MQAQAEALRDLCEVWDNFERALEVKTNDNEKTFDAYRKGVELIFSEFRSALSRRGVHPYSLLGEDFDPSKAEAAGHVETSQARPGQVIEELKKGFMFGDRILRPAQVIVAREAEESKASDETVAKERSGEEKEA